MKHANDNIGVYNCTENYYRHWLLGFKFTDGVKALADHWNAYWLIDLIVSHQVEPKVKAEGFQVWDLKRVKDSKFVAICTDGNKNHVTQQVIPFSDFPFDTATIWLIDGVLLLPSEY